MAKLIFTPLFLPFSFLSFGVFLSHYNSMEKVCVYKGRGLGIQWGKKQTELGCICKGLRMRVRVFVGRGGRTLLEVGCVKPTEGGN